MFNDALINFISIKKTWALIGYTTDAALYSIEYASSRNELDSVLVVMLVIFAFFVVSTKYIIQPKRSKLALPGHCLLHARRRFIRAVVPQAPSDPAGSGPDQALRLPGAHFPSLIFHDYFITKSCLLQCDR